MNNRTYLSQLACLSCILSPATHAGLISVYKFDETTGGTAVDSIRSGTGDGTLNNFGGSQWVSGKIGNCLLFDGSDDYINALNTVPTGTTAFTISVWVNPTTAPGWATIVKNWGSVSTGSFHFGINQTANRIGNFLTNGTNTQAPSNLPLNTWSHLAVTYNGATNTQRLYINGSLVATNTGAPASLTALGTRMGIGVKLNEPAQDAPSPVANVPGFWNGRLDDLAFWDETLTDAQILEIRNNGELGIGVLDLAVTKADQGTDLNATTSWVGDIAPASDSIAFWNGTSLGAGLTLDAATSWKGIGIVGAASDITITGTGDLTLGAIGINMAAATANLSMSQPVTLGTDQVWTVNGGRTLTASGNISGAFSLTKESAGTLVLSGNNAAATGGMTLNGGITQFESFAAINGTAGDDLTLNSGATVVFGPAFETGTDIPTALGTRIVVRSTGTIAADNHASRNFDFSAAGLNGAFLGSVGNVSYAGTLTPAGTTYRLGGGGGTLTMANTNAITGTGNSLVVRGNVTLAAANDYDSGTTINAGTLAVGSDGSLGSGSLTINGGTIQSADSTAHTLANPLVLGSGVTVGGTGDLTFSDFSDTSLGATRTFTINNPASTFAQAFSGTGFGITKSGTGDMTLSGANTYSGTTTVSAGTLTLTGSNTSGGVTTLTAGTLKLGGTFNAGLTSGTLTFGNASLDVSIIQAVIADQSISNAVNLNQNNGTISGSQNLRINGTFTNSGGNRTLTNSIDSGKALTLAGQISITTNSTARTFTIAGTGATNVSGVVANGSTGIGSLTKTGAGTMNLTNTNTYTGATNITGGTLAVSGSAAVNTTNSITVNGDDAAFMHNSSVTNSRAFTLTNGTLGGTGTISTAITAGANVTLAPGDRTLVSPAKGTLTVTNSVSLTSATSRLDVRIFGPTADDNDKLVQTESGTMNFDGTLEVSLDSSWTPVPGTTYDLIDWIGSPTGTFTSISLPTLPTGFKWRDYGSGVFFDYTTGQIQIIADLPGYASWQSVNGATGQTLDEDHDKDGVPNGVEFFIGGPNGNTTGFTTLPGVVKSDGGLSVTWTKASDYTGVFGTDYIVETSDTLTGSWFTETLGGTLSVTGNTVKFTFPTPLIGKKFVRLRVTQTK